MLSEPDHSLTLQAGAGYRHQSFEIGGTESSPTVDFGVKHMWILSDWLRMRNAFTFSPAINDFAAYLARHDSSIEMPIGTGPWSLRFGLRNDYNSQPDAGRRNLDTEYYSRLLMNFH